MPYVIWRRWLGDANRVAFYALWAPPTKGNGPLDVSLLVSVQRPELLAYYRRSTCPFQLLGLGVVQGVITRQLRKIYLNPSLTFGWMRGTKSGDLNDLLNDPNLTAIQRVWVCTDRFAPPAVANPGEEAAA